MNSILKICRVGPLLGLITPVAPLSRIAPCGCRQPQRPTARAVSFIDPKRPSRLLTNGHSHVAKYWCRKIGIALNRLGGRTVEATIQRRTCCSWRSAGHSKASFHKSLVRLKLAESGCPRSSDVRLRFPVVIDRRCKGKCLGHCDRHNSAHSRSERAAVTA